jgi:acetyltransferase-like isoleucine patch superfamily enzyme
MSVRIHPTALVEDAVEIGPGTVVGGHAHIRRGTRIGAGCFIGEKTQVACGVRLGSRVRVNALVHVCPGVTVEDGVLICAGTVFANDRFPRATTPDLSALRPSGPGEHTRPTLVREGATVSAGCTVGNDLVIGRWAMVGMASVVTRSVPDFHLAVGHPARSVGCVCRCGQLLLRFSEPIVADREDLVCGACGLRYALRHGAVIELTPPAPRRAA